MTAGGWIFMVVCWTVLTALTVWCFKMVLTPKPEVEKPGNPAPKKETTGQP